MTKRLKTILQYCLFLGLGIFLIWWSLKDLTASDRQEITQSLQKGNYGYIFPGLTVLILSHWVRALRWRLLMEPMGYTPSRATTFFAVMVGYLANQAVPRLGEVLRCSTLTRYEKIPFDKLLGTVILERMVDAISLLILLGLAMISQPHLYDSIIQTFFAGSAEKQESGSILWYFIGGLIVLLIVGGIWMRMTKRSLKDLLNATKKIGLHVWQGFITIKNLKRPWTFVLLTIALWSLYTLCVYTGFLMLQETSGFGWKEAITVLCAGSLGMIATPGGIGAYAFLVQKTMLLYQLNNGMGLALGWILWFLQTGAVLIFGALSLIALPIYNKNK